MYNFFILIYYYFKEGKILASEPLVSPSKCQVMESSIQPDTTTPVKQPPVKQPPVQQPASLSSDGQLQTTGVQYIIF